MTRRCTLYELQSELLKGVRYGIIKGSVIGVAKEDTGTLGHKHFPTLLRCCSVTYLPSENLTYVRIGSKRCGQLS